MSASNSLISTALEAGTSELALREMEAVSRNIIHSNAIEGLQFTIGAMHGVSRALWWLDHFVTDSKDRELDVGLVGELAMAGQLLAELASVLRDIQAACEDCDHRSQIRA